MIRHFFYDIRSKESRNNLQLSINKIFNRIKIFYKIIDNDLFGKNLFKIIIGIIILLIFLYFTLLKNKKSDKDDYLDNNEKNIIIKYCIIFISILMYFLFVSNVVIYISSRYMVPIYCITFTVFISFIIFLIMKVIKKKKLYLFFNYSSIRINL